MGFLDCRIAAASIVFGLFPLAVSAEDTVVPGSPQTGSLTVILQSNGTRVDGGSCSLVGSSTTKAVAPDAAGTCTFEPIAPGIYRLDVTASGFLPQITNVTVVGGVRATVRCTLNEPTLNSLAVIGRLRLERAMTLMAHTEAALAEVALAAGFADQSHMSRAFRRLTGVTPADWRRAHKPTSISERRVLAS